MEESPKIKLSLFRKPSLVVDLTQSRRLKTENQLMGSIENQVKTKGERREPEEEFFAMTLLSEILSSKSKNSIIESQ